MHSTAIPQEKEKSALIIAVLCIDKSILLRLTIPCIYYKEYHEYD